MKRITSLYNLYGGNAKNKSDGLCVLWDEDVYLTIIISMFYFIEFQVYNSEKDANGDDIILCQQLHYLYVENKT